MPLIELKGVSKSYKRDAIDIPVLDGVSITVPEGDFLGLMGPSGSGKSTLLNLLAGIDRPSRGTIRIGGTEVSSLSERALAAWRARHIGFIFQLYNLIPVLTAFENVELPLLLTALSKKQRREHVMTALGIVGLTDREKHYPRQLSGGQEQRVAIARAIVTDPTLLLADEPERRGRGVPVLGAARGARRVRRGVGGELGDADRDDPIDVDDFLDADEPRRRDSQHARRAGRHLCELVRRHLQGPEEFLRP